MELLLVVCGLDMAREAAHLAQVCNAENERENHEEASDCDLLNGVILINVCNPERDLVLNVYQIRVCYLDKQVVSAIG
jgi:hypothetical protein